MKKTAVYLFILTTLMLLLFSCGQGGDNEEIFIPPEEDSAVDLSGYNFVYLQNGTVGDEISFAYKENTIVADAALKRIAEIQEKYNFNYVERLTGNIGNVITLEVASNDTNISAVQWSTHTSASVDITRAGYFLPLSEVSDYIDYTDNEKWGEPSRLESLCWNNELFGVVPVAWPEYDISDCDFPLIINMDYITEIGAENPREYVEAGVWNRDKFLEIIRRYSHYNSSNEWIYGFTANTYHFALMASATSGLTYVTQDDRGVWNFSGLFSSKAIESFEWLRNIFYGEYKDCILPTSNDNTEQVIQGFSDRKAVMMLMHSSFVFQTRSANSVTIAYEDMPFALLPFPNLDPAQYGEWVSIHAVVKFVINLPVITPEPEAAAFILNELYEPLEGFETLEIRREYYERNIFHDARDAQIFYKMMENNQHCHRADKFNPVISPLAFQTASKTVSEVLQSIEAQALSIMEATIIPTKESFAVVFGTEK